MPGSPVSPRPAASVVVARQGDPGLEVLMVERPARGFFGGLMVFPGGAVDPCDFDMADSVESAHVLAALRETAEEVGILLTEAGHEKSPQARGAELLHQIGRDRLLAAGSALALISRWVTPRAAPKRFDTRFYLAGMEGEPEIVLDDTELIAYSWTTPQDALNRLATGEWTMILPTIAHLRWLALRKDLNAAFSAAAGTDGLTIIEPIFLDDGSLSPRYRGD